MRKSHRLVTVLALALPALAGCNVDLIGGGSSGDCTEIGCTNSVTIQLAGQLEQGTVITIFATDGSNAIRSITCNTPGECEEEIVLTGFAPASLEIEVIRPDGTVEDRVAYEPTYERFQPNGEGCLPICLVAEVTLAA